MESIQIGRQGIYHLTFEECERFGGNHAVGANESFGEPYRHAPAIVVSVNNGDSVNLKVFTDAKEDQWATSRHIGKEPGMFEPYHGHLTL